MLDFSWIDAIEEGWRPGRQGWWLQRMSWNELRLRTGTNAGLYLLISEFKAWSDQGGQWQYVLTWDFPAKPKSFVYIGRKKKTSGRAIQPAPAPDHSSRVAG